MARCEIRQAPGTDPMPDTPVNNRLVLLAIETSDPVVYALALSQCGDHGYNMAAGPCQGLSWEHWANIDPDNAMPWLAIAAKAGNSGDRQRVEEALAKASMASHFDTLFQHGQCNCARCASSRYRSVGQGRCGSRCHIGPRFQCHWS